MAELPSDSADGAAANEPADTGAMEVDMARTKRALREARESLDEAADSAKTAARKVADVPGAVVDDARARTREEAGKVLRAAKETEESLLHGVERRVRTVERRVKELQREMRRRGARGREYVEEHPGNVALAAGLCGFCLGLVLARRRRSANVDSVDESAV